MFTRSWAVASGASTGCCDDVVCGLVDLLDGGAGGEAAAEDADEPIGDVPEGGVVWRDAGTLAVVAGPRAWWAPHDDQPCLCPG